MMPLVPAPATTPRAPQGRGPSHHQPKSGASPSLSSKPGLLLSPNIPKCISAPPPGLKIETISIIVLRANIERSHPPCCKTAQQGPLGAQAQGRALFLGAGSLGSSNRILKFVMLTRCSVKRPWKTRLPPSSPGFPGVLFRLPGSRRVLRLARHSQRGTRCPSAALADGNGPAPVREWSCHHRPHFNASQLPRKGCSSRKTPSLHCFPKLRAVGTFLFQKQLAGFPQKGRKSHR